MGAIKDAAGYAGMCACGGCVIFCVVGLITILASLKSLKHDEQLIVHYLDGKVAYNGPSGAKVYSPFREKETRKQTRLLASQYVRIKDMKTGDRRIVEGPVRFFLGAYEETDGGTLLKFVVPVGSYIRFVDQLSGAERVVPGRATVAPEPWEDSESGPQQAPRIDMENAVIVLNKETGERYLNTTIGAFYPKAYEVVADRVTRMRVEAQETVVMKNAFGKFTVHRGPRSTGQSVTVFFKKPYEEIVEHDWSSYSDPGAGGLQTIGVEKITRISMRERSTHYQFDARTSDNVAIRLQGVVRWEIEDVAKMIAKTADPVGDVWYMARSTIMSVCSGVDLMTFSLGPPRVLIQAAMGDSEFQGDFYSSRGVKYLKVTVTWEALDQMTKETLQEINKENDNRINKIQAQRSENEVKEAKLKADIRYENAQKVLIETQSANDKLLAARDGEAEGVQQAEAAKSFLDGLNATMPNIDTRLDLYNLHKQLESQNTRTRHIADGKSATLFLTPDQLNLNSKKEL